MTDRPEWLGTYRVILHALITAPPSAFRRTDLEQSHIAACHACLVHGGTVDDADAEHEYMHKGREVRPCPECRLEPKLESGEGLWYISCEKCGVGVNDLRFDKARITWNGIEAKDPCGAEASMSYTAVPCCLPSGHGGSHENKIGIRGAQPGQGLSLQDVEGIAHRARNKQQ